jgi:hypothetical protein
MAEQLAKVSCLMLRSRNKSRHHKVTGGMGHIICKTSQAIFQ